MVVRSCWPIRRRVYSVELIWAIWGRGGGEICRPRWGCSRYERQGYAQTFPRCGHWMRVRGICGLRPPASSGASPRSLSCKRWLKAHRLVTLPGVGGVGKPRLAVEVAARLAEELPDGVWLFELAAVTDPAAVPDAVAAGVGITQQTGKTAH